MKRREFFRKAGIGSAALVTIGSSARSHAASTSHAQQHPTISGPLATATVSFGAWTALPGTGTLNRFPNVGQAPGVANNVHAMIPHEVKIKAGGSVNFIIAGFHLLAIYDDGTQPGDISTATLISPTITPPAPPLINDPNNRIYFGIDPGVLPRLPPPIPRSHRRRRCRIASRLFTFRTRARSSSYAPSCRTSWMECSDTWT